MGRMGRDLPALFRKLKKMPYFAKKKPNCVHLWVKFLIYDTVLRLSRKKKLLFMCCRRNVCRSALILRNLPSPKKILDVPPASKCYSPNTSCKTNGIPGRQMTWHLIQSLRIPQPLPKKLS